MEMKKCTKCGREFPMTSEYFYRQKATKCGYRSKCKKCCDEVALKYYDKNKKDIKEKQQKYRDENREEIRKREKEYYKSEKSQEKRKLYYKNNKEKILSDAKKWRENNKDRVEELKRNDYVKNRETIITKVGKWQKENREKANQKVAKYQRTEKGKITTTLKRAKYDNKIKSLLNTLTNEQWESIKQHFNNSCAYCGQVKKLEHEHVVPVSKNGELTHNNIVPACKSCNTSKGNKDFIEWYNQQEFYSEDRKNKILKFINNNKKEEV